MAGVGISGFTGDTARRRFARAYAEMAERRLPPDATAIDVPTTFGTTRAYRIAGHSGAQGAHGADSAEAEAGPAGADSAEAEAGRAGSDGAGTGRAGAQLGDGVPFVLLPGAGGNALSWHASLGRLRAARPVIALDPVGEPGASVQDKPLTSGGDWAAWLHETLTALEVERAHLVGVSFGGWVALQHELHHPGRAETITLLDPAGFGRLTGRFLAWIILGGLAAFTPTPVRHLAARPLRNATLLDDDLMGLLRASGGFRRRHLNPPELTDAELNRVSAPTQVLLGGRSQMYTAGAVAARIRDRMPSAVAEIVPGAGHDLPVRCVELVSDRTIAFAAREAHPAQG